MKKLLVILMSIVMIVTLMPATAFAEIDTSSKAKLDENSYFVRVNSDYTTFDNQYALSATETVLCYLYDKAADDKCTTTDCVTTTNMLVFDEDWNIIEQSSDWPFEIEATDSNAAISIKWKNGETLEYNEDVYGVQYVIDGEKTSPLWIYQATPSNASENTKEFLMNADYNSIDTDYFDLPVSMGLVFYAENKDISDKSNKVHVEYKKEEVNSLFSIKAVDDVISLSWNDTTLSHWYDYTDEMFYAYYDEEDPIMFRFASQEGTFLINADDIEEESIKTGSSSKFENCVEFGQGETSPNYYLFNGEYVEGFDNTNKSMTCATGTVIKNLSLHAYDKSGNDADIEISTNTDGTYKFAIGKTCRPDEYLIKESSSSDMVYSVIRVKGINFNCENTAEINVDISKAPDDVSNRFSIYIPDTVSSESLCNISAYQVKVKDGAVQSGGAGYGGIDYYSDLSSSNEFYWSTFASWTDYITISTSTNGKYELSFKSCNDNDYPGLSTIKLYFKEDAEKNPFGTLYINYGVEISHDDGIIDVYDYHINHEGILSNGSHEFRDEAKLETIDGAATPTGILQNISQHQYCYSSKTDEESYYTELLIGERVFMDLELKDGYVVDKILVNGSPTDYAIVDNYYYALYDGETRVHPDTYSLSGSGNEIESSLWISNLMRGNATVSCVIPDAIANNPLDKVRGTLDDNNLTAKLQDSGTVYAVALDPNKKSKIEIITTKITASDTNVYYPEQKNGKGIGHAHAFGKSKNADAGQGKYKQGIQNYYDKEKEPTEVYDLEPQEGFDGLAYVVIPYKGAKEKNAKAVWYDEYASNTNVSTPVPMITYYTEDGDGIIFMTNHFSEYGIVQDKVTPVPTPKPDVPYVIEKTTEAIVTSNGETNVSVKYEIGKDNIVSVKVTEDLADKIKEQIDSNEVKKLEINCNTAEESKGFLMEIPRYLTEEVGKKDDTSISFKTKDDEVTLDNKACDVIASKESTENFKVDFSEVTELTEAQKKAVANGGKVVDINFYMGDTKITEFGKGSVSFTTKLPEGLTAENAAVVYIPDSGMFQKAKYTTANGKITVTANHASAYAIIAKEEAEALIKESNAAISDIVKNFKPKTTTVKMKKGIRATVKCDVTQVTNLGYTVKYKFYRSEKKRAGYVSKMLTNNAKYVNTAGKKNAVYYYKAIVCVYDKENNLIAKTALNQSTFGVRKF